MMLTGAAAASTAEGEILFFLRRGMAVCLIAELALRFRDYVYGRCIEGGTDLVQFGQRNGHDKSYALKSWLYLTRTVN